MRLFKFTFNFFKCFSIRLSYYYFLNRCITEYKSILKVNKTLMHFTQRITEFFAYIPFPSSREFFFLILINRFTFYVEKDVISFLL